MPISLGWDFNHMIKTYYKIVMHDVPGFYGETKSVEVDYFIEIEEVIDDWCSCNYDVYKITVEKLNLDDY